MSASVSRDKLSMYVVSDHSTTVYCQTYIALVFVPSCDTITVASVGSNPTNPRRSVSRYGFQRRKMISQNGSSSPSPPTATGSKVGLASQFAPHDQVAVCEGLQYPVLA